MRAAILSETATATDDPLFFRPNYDKMYLLGNPPDYEQPPENALGAQARRQGRQPEELAYDAMLTDEGRGMLYVPFLNYADGNLDAVREMLRDPSAVPGLSDGGAHCGIICDASFPTYLLTHWTRDRSRGEKLSIPFVVAAQSRKTALSVGLYDRGVIAPGFKADVNVIDYDRLHLHPPKVHYDLPVGGRRLMQQVDGYDATIVSGVVTQRGGKATGARPGQTGARRAGWCRAQGKAAVGRGGELAALPTYGVVPALNAGTHTPRPIVHGDVADALLKQSTSVVMGPCVRRDDERVVTPSLTQTSAAPPPAPSASRARCSARAAAARAAPTRPSPPH